jgi:hypothetical protein
MKRMLLLVEKSIRNENLNVSRRLGEGSHLNPSTTEQYNPNR